MRVNGGIRFGTISVATIGSSRQNERYINPGLGICGEWMKKAWEVSHFIQRKIFAFNIK